MKCWHSGCKEQIETFTVNVHACEEHGIVDSLDEKMLDRCFQRRIYQLIEQYGYDKARLALLDVIDRISKK